MNIQGIKTQPDPTLPVLSDVALKVGAEQSSARWRWAAMIASRLASGVGSGCSKQSSSF